MPPPSCVVATDGVLAADWDADLPVYSVEDDSLATRNASKNAIAGLKDNVPELLGRLRRPVGFQPHRHGGRRRLQC